MNKTGTIIIVGASSGIGRAIAQHYASNGWVVGICARRSEALAELAGEFSGNVFAQTLDVTADDAVDTFTDFITRLGGVDVVLYAAGCGCNNPTLEAAKDERTVQTNVVGFTRIINAAFKWFAENPTPSGRKGHICAITSIAGTKGIGISATYSATKRYECNYIEALAQLARVRGVNVRFTDIRPGFVDTALLDTQAHKYPMLMSVDYAAPRIIKAINKARPVAYIDWRWHLVVIGWRMIPRCIWVRLKLKI